MNDSNWKLTGMILVLLLLAAPAALAKKGGGGGKPGGGDPPTEAAPVLAYFSGGDLMVMDADGGNATRVLAGVANQNLVECSWSPDGERIAFRGNISGDGIYVVGVDGSGLTQIYAGSASYLTWSPSLSSAVPEKIVFRSGADLWLVNPDGTQPRQLTTISDWVESYPAWSPDGTRLAVRFNDVVKVGSTFTVTTAGLEIYNLVFDSAGLATIASTDRIVEDTTNPASVGFAWMDWSRDGSYIAYADYDDITEQYDLWMIDLSAPSNAIQLTDTPDADERSPAWSADDLEIAYERYGRSKKNSGLQVLTVTSGEVSSLGAKSGRMPEWSR